MLDTIISWRGELFTALALLTSWGVFRYGWHASFWPTFLAGTVLGLAIEVITEPEWNYSMHFYLWRDISPFTILGWGILFSWLIQLSDACYEKLFSSPAVTPDLRILLTDLLVGLPLILSSELFGIYVLKIWQYSPILGWNTMLPVLHYPVEGIVAAIFFILGLTSSVRYWKRKASFRA